MKWFKNIWNRIRIEIHYRKQLKKLNKRDPYVYK